MANSAYARPRPRRPLSAGRSVVVDPHGVIVADAGEQERVLSAVLDPETVLAWRRDFPALRDAHWCDVTP